VSGGDGIDSSTQVPAISSMSVLVALSYHAMHLMPLPFMDLAPIAFLGVESPPGVAVGGPSMLQAGLQGGSIVG
jgi:hypothetical protein